MVRGRVRFEFRTFDSQYFLCFHVYEFIYLFRKDLCSITIHQAPF